MQSKIEIPGIPSGWKLVRIGAVGKGEFYIDCLGNVIQACGQTINKSYAIVRKIEPPDPGEGWRWVEPGEELRDNDEFQLVGGEWAKTMAEETTLELNGKYTYRRRLPRYRPFANAKEFEPHRDRWIRQCCGARGRFTRYTDTLVFHHEQSVTWKVLFDTCVFDDDGSKCGVKVE